MRLLGPQGRPLWLTYCMNVHDGSAASQARAIEEVVLPLRERLGGDGPFGVGLRFHAAGLATLASDEAARDAFIDLLRRHRLVPFTANAFVVGAFHGRTLKDEVYRPSWRHAGRLAYTLDLARVMAALVEGTGAPRHVSLSTSPLAWRPWGEEEAEREAGALHLAEAARALVHLEAETGARVTLGLEPEPGCTLDRMADAATFLAEDVRRRLQDDDEAFQHLGICYDVCHQAVVGESVDDGLQALDEAGIPVVKAQLTCALEVPDPLDPAQRAALRTFDEGVYLHQVGGLDDAGRAHLVPDLGPALAGDSGLATSSPWRVHFHVPVFRKTLVGGLRTTHAHLERLLERVATAPITDHLEIETYTFDRLPEGERREGSGFDLVDALEQEFRSVLATLAHHGVRAPDLETRP